VERNIKKLQEKGLLKRVGPDKGGRWEVIGEDAK
jgi:ATP-dependent DNA helicase RecG